MIVDYFPDYDRNCFKAEVMIFGKGVDAYGDILTICETEHISDSDGRFDTVHYNSKEFYIHTIQSTEGDDFEDEGLKALIIKEIEKCGY